MRKLIVEEWMSLDGYVADKNGRLDFFTHLSPQQNTYSDADQLRFLDTVDTILLGRKTYDLFVDFWPAANTETEVIADRLNEIDKVVLSGSLQQAPWGNWKAATVISGDAVQAIQRLKALPGKNIVLWGSISLVQLLVKEGLADELHIQLCPALTGGGRRLFEHEADFKQLKLMETRRYDTGTVFLSYALNSNND